MQIKDTILAVVLLGVILVSIGACYKVYVMDRHYQVLSLVACDPAEESCFSLFCDKESEDYHEDLCQQVTPGEKRFFSFIRKQAKNIESCDARSEECPDLTCEEGEAGCEIITCTEETLVEYGDESMGCTPEVIVPVEPAEPIEELPAEVLEPVTVPAMPAEEAVPPTPSVTDEEVLTPAEVTPAPEEEPLPEPTHNLPI